MCRDRSMRLLVIAIFASVRKDEEKKNEEKKTTLTARISELAGAISFKFGM